MTSYNNNPFLFASGVPRSGTTLLQRMLNCHPELAVANDSHFIPRALELTDKSLVDQAVMGNTIPLSTELINNVRNYHRFYRLGISDDQFDAAVAVSNSYQQLVSELYKAHALNSGKRLAGEKTPDYSRRLLLLNGLFPKAKLVHLIRDGRNVAMSQLQWAKPNKGPGRIGLWKEQPIAVCALWWRWMALTGREHGMQLDAGTYTEVSYEALTVDPDQELNTLCDFLGLEFNAEMLEYNRGKTRPQRNQSAKNAWLEPRPGLRNWENDMPTEDIELFEALASDALELFGYEIRNRQFSKQTTDVAAECERWWQKNFLSKFADVVPFRKSEANSLDTPLPVSGLAEER